MSNEKPWIYIASPYTRGDVAINVRAQMEAFDAILAMGAIPIAPLFSHFQHMFKPRPYEDWIELDLEIVKRCDACIRLAAVAEFSDGTVYRQYESSGADGEVMAFARMAKPVFVSMHALEAWINGRTVSESSPVVHENKGGDMPGLRTERVVLEINTHVDSANAGRWPWGDIPRKWGLDSSGGESVRVVPEGEAIDAAVESEAWDGARDAYRGAIAKLNAERDALAARVADLESQLESVACRAATAETALESAPAASGAANDTASPNSSEPVAWGVRDKTGKVVAASTLYAYAEAVSQSRLTPYQGAEVVGDAIPLYTATPPAAGWLTGEEREAVAFLASGRSQFAPTTPYEAKRNNAIDACHRLLARNAPPEVVTPKGHGGPKLDFETTIQRRDRQWIAALAAAGVECQQ